MQSEDIMSIIKNTISASVKYNTIRGYIGWSSCDDICMDMHDCLDMCKEPFEAGEYMTALEAALYVLISGVKLASYADSSSGMLTDVIMCAYEWIEKCTQEIAKKDKSMRDVALALIIKEAKKKAFDGWTSWRYDLLKYGICLCDEKSSGKFEKVLDMLLENMDENYSIEYYKQEDLIARYLLRRHLKGKEEARKELYKNIHVRELCLIAVKDAIEESDYKEAERLCLDKLKNEMPWHYRKNDPEDWNNLLFAVYVAEGNTDKQIAQAKKLLLYGNEDFWDTLKLIYKKSGIWQEKYQELLDELKASKKTVCYRSILVAENEKKRLLEDVQDNPYDLFYYGKFLVKDYPDQIYELCYRMIMDNCSQAKDRREYKKVAKQISQLIKWKGTDTAKKLITQLKQNYPRRPALLDELGKVAKKL